MLKYQLDQKLTKNMRTAEEDEPVSLMHVGGYTLTKLKPGNRFLRHLPEIRNLRVRNSA